MNLKEALSTLIGGKGINILKTPLSLNILSDYKAFDEHPSSKNVLKAIIEEGYLEKIAFFYENELPLGEAPIQYASEMYHRLGFRSDISTYVLNALLGALGYDEIYDQNSESLSIKNTSWQESGNANSQGSIQPNKDSHFEFKGVTIDGSKDIAIEQLKNLGFNLIEDSSDGALFSGKFAGIEDCQILVSVSQHTNKLYCISVITPPRLNWWSIKADYDNTNQMIQKKYGQPIQKTEFFADPYEDGDGYELTALETGNAFFATQYESKHGRIKVFMASNANLYITYEDKSNGDEHEAAEAVQAQNDI